ncbi:MAG: ParB N-terminal domain-containing protein [Lawsonibacter sp.]|nr:ParB N-terminal domain-containing protein [Lawsonibacter sp.]
MEMQLVIMKLSEIRPYERNPRRNDPAVGSVMESIQQCTYVAPIVVDEDGVILAGHTRYQALKKLKRKEAEVIVKAGLSEEQKRKYRLLDNKTAELAGWDLDLLAGELEGLDFGSLELDWGIGIDEGEPEADTGVGGENVEYAPEAFGDEKFSCQCPKCGFWFND